MRIQFILEIYVYRPKIETKMKIMCRRVRQKLQL